MKDLTNKKLLKEWKKIETANIFSQLEEFADFYYANGEKSCFRIITSEPWSKDNFFFGDYTELLNYYKNEFPKRRIGQKFHSLTILDVFYKNVNGQELLYTKCRCDCGNETEKLLENMIKGSSRTCGCKNKQEKGISKTSIYDAFPEIINKYWDFKKNTILPQTIPLDSTEEFWWKGYNHSYKMPISLIKQKQIGTSFPEQTILFFLKANNIKVLHRNIIKYKKRKYELDLYLPDYNVAIEYDGVMWHSDKLNKDKEKNNALQNLNIFLIRIRENGLPPTEISYGREISMTEERHFVSLSNAINELFSQLSNLYKIQLKKISPNDIKKNQLLIYRQYLFSFKENSIANSLLIKYWAKENSIEPYLVPVDSSDKFIFRCPMGKEFYVSPKRLTQDNNKKCLLSSSGVCDHYDLITEGLLISNLIHKNTEKYTKINFSLENHFEIKLQEIEPLKIYIIGKNGNLQIDNKINLKLTQINNLTNPLYRKCLLSLYEFKNSSIFISPPFSITNYELNLENDVYNNSDCNILIANKLYASNWTYNLFIAIKKEKGNLYISAKIFSNSQLSFALWDDKYAIKSFYLKNTFNKMEIIDLINHILPEKQVQQPKTAKDLYQKALNIYNQQKQQTLLQVGAEVIHKKYGIGVISKIISPKLIQINFKGIEIQLNTINFSNGNIMLNNYKPKETIEHIYEKLYKTNYI